MKTGLYWGAGVMGLFLLIVGGLIAWVVVAGVTKANRRMAYADQKAVERELKAVEDDPHMMPTWLQKPGRLREFLARVEATLRSREVPPRFVERILGDDLEYHRIMHLVALLERRKGGLSAQVTAAADFIWDKWVAQELHRVGLPTWGRSKEDVDRFVKDMYALVEERSIPPTFFTALMANPDAIAELMRCVVTAERQGASLAGQKAAAGQFVFDRWLVLPEDQKKPFMDDYLKDLIGSAYRPSVRQPRVIGPIPEDEMVWPPTTDQDQDRQRS